MRKAMKNTLFGTALVAALMAAGTAANAQRPGFEERGRVEARGGFDHNFAHPAFHEGFHEGYRGGYVRPVGPAYPRYGFGVAVGVPAPVVDTYADTYAPDYVPPCPGDGYDWNAGYYNAGVWVPGAWRLRAGFVGRPYGFARGPVAYERGYAHPGFRAGFNGRR